MKRVFRFDLLTLLLSLGAGLLWSVLGGLLYNGLLGKLWTPLLIAVYFLGLSLCLLFAILVSNAIGDNAKPRAVQYKKTAVVMAVLFFAGMLFEVLYELQPVQFNPGKPTSYIFLIDDSGSMYANDPQFVRNDAVYEVVTRCEDGFPFAVYKFTDTCTQVLPVTQAKDVQRTNYGFTSDGGTDILGAVATVLDDIKAGRLQAGTAPRILLLSDGVSYDDGYRSTMLECINNGVSISTVGFGSADREMLQRLAQDTRGVFVWAEDISNLVAAMNTAASAIAAYTRDLLGYRPFTASDTLFAVLRCVFLCALAVGFILIKMFMFNTFDRSNAVLIVLLICAAAGALGVELLINGLNLSPGLARVLLCVMFLILLGATKKKGGSIDNYTTGNQEFGGFSNSGFAGYGDKWKF